MMMADDKKKMATLIVGKMSGNMEKPMEEVEQKDGAEQDASLPLEAAAEEIMSAFNSNSPKALVESLKSFMELCEALKGDEKEY